MTTMRRRQFARDAGLAAAFALAGVTARAGAQGATPVEGRDFKRLVRPVPVTSAGKIQVIEFFWYGCPHCFIFEPLLDDWIAKLPADVAFRRVPVAFDARREVHQRVFYTWEALGLLGTMHLRTFTRFNAQRKPIDSLDDMLAFARDNQLDAAKVQAAWNSFSVQARCREAGALTRDYDISQTPEMGIQGRFTAVGSPTSMLATTDWLVERFRHGH
jgi:protein dithiol oxidoreductase (disulfide-forming)